MHFHYDASPSNAFPWLIGAFPCCSVASKTYAIHFRGCVTPRHCVSVRGDSLLCHSISIRSGARPCCCFSGCIEATHFDAQPSRVTASQYFAFAVLGQTAQSKTIAPRCVDVAPRFDSLHFLCHALPYSAFPLLGEAGPGVAAAILFNSLLFLCFAEIRIAPQSLRCSSRPKTELSRAYAVLGRSALRLSVAMPGRTPLFLCCARRNPAELGFAFAHPIDAMPCHCEAHQITANPRHCPVRRAY